MDKRVIFAVAGSGKTTYIIKQLNLIGRFLLITYTKNNVNNLRTGIIRKFGYLPENITLYSYFSFLYQFCYSPLLSYSYGANGITHEPNYNWYLKKTDKAYYIDSNNRLYSARISKLLIEQNMVDKLNARLSKYFDYILFDEIQDVAGNDFNLLKHISQANTNQLFVGDFYQHTFDTSRDGNVNNALHEKFEFYQKQFISMGMTVDSTTLSKSYRCSPTTCQFISDKLNIKIDSHRSDKTSFELIQDEHDAINILQDNNIVKLFYQEHYKYNCFSSNYGNCKGNDQYNDVCVVLNKTTANKFESGKLHESKQSTKNKLYVALSRAKNNLYLMPESYIKCYSKV